MIYFGLKIYVIHNRKKVSKNYFKVTQWVTAPSKKYYLTKNKANATI